MNWEKLVNFVKNHKEKLVIPVDDDFVVLMPFSDYSDQQKENVNNVNKKEVEDFNENEVIDKQSESNISNKGPVAVKDMLKNREWSGKISDNNAIADQSENDTYYFEEIEDDD